MRWHILRTLIHKELLRQLANRGGIVLAALLVCIALMLSLWQSGSAGALLGGDVQRCYLVYRTNDPAYADIKPWIEYLRSRIPSEWDKDQLRIRRTGPRSTSADNKMATDPVTGQILLDPNVGQILIESNGRESEGGPWRFRVQIWHPGQDSGVLALYETWFWKETRRYFQRVPEIEEQHERVIGSPDIRSAVAAALLVFAMFFTCVYLLPSMTCEERERGVLLAQALTPASPFEILAAKFFCFPLMGIALAALLGGIYRPAVLTMPFFWLALFAASVGSLGIGLTIATLARTQRLASVVAMCYLLILAMFEVTIFLNQIPFLSELVIEGHNMKTFHAAMANAVTLNEWVNLVEAAVLAGAWATLATVLFRYRGWQ